MPLQHATTGDSLADVVERVLDKGLVINADIVISLCNTELLSIKLRAALASFETAAKWGLAFPSDMRVGNPGKTLPTP
ncbi:MAG: gas vesicle protein [Gammaproteobacteria bacterium]|nr:gas vesicle protein [Gammaproteobacteria bacterium]